MFQHGIVKDHSIRFEIIAAFAMGVLLPVLKTARRSISHWTINFTTMFEDYVADALLLIGGWSSYRSKSFVSQLEETLRQTASEPNNLLVVVVKVSAVEFDAFLPHCNTERI